MHLVKKKERTYEKAKEILTSKNLLINDGKTERIKRRGKRMERCDKIRIKAWRSGRHQEKKRTGDHSTCKELYHLEKEMENKTNNQNQPV